MRHAIDPIGILSFSKTHKKFCYVILIRIRYVQPVQRTNIAYLFIRLIIPLFGFILTFQQPPEVLGGLDIYHTLSGSVNREKE